MDKKEFEKELDEKLASLKNEMMQKFEEQDNTFPQVGDTYWFIDSTGFAKRSKWEGDNIDNTRLAIGNIAPTKEEMEFERERRKVIKELEKYAEKDKKWNRKNKHHHILWDYTSNKVDYFQSLILQGADIYFESVEKAKKAVKAVGEDRVKRFYLRVED